MRVLFFIESLRAGGKERRIVELLKAFRQNYHNVDIILVLTRKEIHYQEIYQLNIPIYFIERWMLKKDPSVFFRFYWLARKIKPDLIHVWGHMVAFYAVPAKKWLNIPMINNEITDATPNQNLIGKAWVFNASNKIIANTKAGLLAYDAPAQKSGVIYNGFNFNRLLELSPVETIRAKFGLSTKWIVAMVASFSDHKDYETYLLAASILLQQNKDISFLCVGDGDFQNLKSQYPQEQIFFLGKQTGVESIMSACHLGVLTTNTRNHEEGISNALLEFMALGKPVIATNSGGSKELIINATSGFLIDAFNAVELADKVNYLLSHETELQAMGHQAKARVEASFSIAAMADGFYKEYQSAIVSK